MFSDCLCLVQPATGVLGTPSPSNPIMSYDSHSGNPNTLGLVPVYPLLPCKAYDINGTSGDYGWNPTLAKWN